MIWSAMPTHYANIQLSLSIPPAEPRGAAAEAPNCYELDARVNKLRMHNNPDKNKMLVAEEGIASASDPSEDSRSPGKDGLLSMYPTQLQMEGNQTTLAWYLFMGTACFSSV